MCEEESLAKCWVGITNEQQNPSCSQGGSFYFMAMILKIKEIKSDM